MNSFREMVRNGYNTPSLMFLVGVLFTIGGLNPAHNAIHDAIYDSHSITVHKCKPPYTYGVAVINHHQECLSK